MCAKTPSALIGNSFLKTMSDGTEGPFKSRNRQKILLASVLGTVLFLSTLTPVFNIHILPSSLLPAAVAQQLQLGKVKSEAVGKPSDTAAEFTDSDNILWWDDRDVLIKLKCNGAGITGTGKSVVEDGASAAGTKSIGPCSSEVKLSFTDNCQKDSYAVLTVEAKHFISFIASIPGGTVTASISGIGSATSLGTSTTFDAKLDSSGGAGKFESREEETQRVTTHAEGSTPTGKANFATDRTTTTTSRTTVNVNQAGTDAKQVEKTFTKVITIPCGSSQTLKAESTMSIAKSMTETSGDSADFISTVEMQVLNTMRISEPIVVKHLNNETKGTIPGDIPTLTFAVAPNVIMGATTLLANLPSNLVEPNSLTETHFVFIEPRDSATEVQIRSANETVFIPDSSKLVIPANSTLGSFTLRPVSSGNATLIVSIPDRSSEFQTNVLVSDFSDIERTKIVLLSNDTLTLLPQESVEISLSRTFFKDIMNQKTRLSLQLDGPAIVKILGQEQQQFFDPGQLIKRIQVTATKPGFTVLNITQKDTGVTIPVSIRVASPAEDGKARLTINTVDLAAMPFTGGLWTTIHSTDGTILKMGFTPLEFEGTVGMTYKVSVSNFDDKTFQHWQDDGSTERTRMLNLTSDTTLTAVYEIGDALRGFTPLMYTGTEEQPDLTVNAMTLDNSKNLRIWTIIDPQPNEERNHVDAFNDEPTITISSDTHYDSLVVDENDVLLIESGVTVEATTLTNYGKIINQGTLRLDPFEDMVNKGFIENYGTLAPGGHGTTYNNGTIVIKEDGVMSLARVSSAMPGKLINGEDAVIDNFGFVAVPLYGNHRVSVENNGTMYKECTGTYDLPSNIPGPGLGIFTGNSIVYVCNTATTYTVYIHNYKDRVFDHWEDGSTSRIRTLAIGEDTTITAYYQTG
jgi:hypothetical protein